MKPKPRPGFLLVAHREWRWILHDRAALILIFGVPIFAFVVLTGVFSHPVIRGLGIVIVDADRSETSRIFVEQVAASPGLSVVEFVEAVRRDSKIITVRAEVTSAAHS
jgi:ABC-2 type transport system permease protein